MSYDKYLEQIDEAVKYEKEGELEGCFWCGSVYHTSADCTEVGFGMVEFGLDMASASSQVV